MRRRWRWRRQQRRVVDPAGIYHRRDRNHRLLAALLAGRTNDPVHAMRRRSQLQHCADRRSLRVSRSRRREARRPRCSRRPPVLPRRDRTGPGTRILRLGADRVRLHRRGGDFSELWLIDQDGSSPLMVPTPDHASYPSFFPDGASVSVEVPHLPGPFLEQIAVPSGTILATQNVLWTGESAGRATARCSRSPRRNR